MKDLRLIFKIDGAEGAFNAFKKTNKESKGLQGAIKRAEKSLKGFAQHSKKN